VPARDQVLRAGLAADVQGMQRRIASYPIETGFLTWNLIETVGAFLLGF